MIAPFDFPDFQGIRYQGQFLPHSRAAYLVQSLVPVVNQVERFEPGKRDCAYLVSFNFRLSETLDGFASFVGCNLLTVALKQIRQCCVLIQRRWLDKTFLQRSLGL